MINKAIKNQEIQFFYKNNKWGWLGAIALYFVILLIIQPTFTSITLLNLVFLLPYILLHITNDILFNRAKKDAAFNYKKWQNSITFISAYIGLLIGILPVLYLDLNNSNHTFLCSTILIIGMFGSTVVSASCKRVHVAWSITIILPITILLLQTDTIEYNTLGWLIVFAAIPFSLIMNIHSYNTFHELLKLRYENDELLKTVSHEKEKAEQASFEKSRFLAASSHDLRQPLHALDLFLGALSNENNKSEQKTLLDKAIHSSKALGELLNALMDISKLDAGNITIINESIHTQTFISELIKEFEPVLEKYNISIELDLHNYNIKSDRILLGRIIRNLISNAIKHSQANTIKVRSYKNKNRLLIEVHDNGIGITKNEQQNIFSEFYQLDNVERDRNKGLGLGLAIVKRVAEILNHKIELTSEINKGSCFRINCQLSLTCAPPVIQNNTAEPDISGMLIIIIDDEINVREAMRALLKQWGCEILAADSLQKIEYELSNNNYPAPDMLLIDYRLRDGKTGLQAVTSLQSRYNKTIPAVIITGDTDSSIIEKIKKTDYLLLNKPVSAEKLKQSIKHTFLKTSESI